MTIPTEGFIAIFLTALGLIGIIVASLFRKCPPNQAMLISGMFAEEDGRKFKIIVGGGHTLIPVVQQQDFLSLEVMTIEVHTSAPIITKNGVPIFVEGVAQVKVDSTPSAIATAAEQFMGKTDEQIANIAHETLVGHLRAILGTLEVEQLIQNNEEFASRVQEVSVVDLAKMGLTSVSFTIKEIKDTVGYIEALGRKRTAEMKRDAAIGEAQATKETQIAQAQAAEEGAKAKLLADTRVAEATKNFQLNQAAFAQEVSAKKAASDMMYDIVKAQTQQKLVAETQQIKIVEAQKEVELQAVEVQKREVQLAADITKPAEAEQTRVRLAAQAEQDKRKLLAEADAAAAKLQAQGAADSTRLRAIADAEATKAIGLAQAEAEKARGMANAAIIAAKGQAEAEAMAKKAEAFKQYNDAAMASMVIERLPEIVSAAASPLSKVSSMTVLATGGESAGASKITNDVLNVAVQGVTMVKGLTGIDLTSYLRPDNKSADNRVVDERTP